MNEILNKMRFAIYDKTAITRDGALPTKERTSCQLRKCIFMMAFLVTGTPLGAQTIAVAGYEPPVYTRATPGQVITLFVRGLRPRMATATTLPLPTVLDGVSVEVSDETGFAGLAPLLSITAAGPHDPYLCPRGEFCLTTAVTVQIPVELNVGSQPLFIPPLFTLTVVDRGVRGTPLTFVQFPAIHILKAPIGSEWAVAHLDGSLVTETNPARPSETLVMYAVGLGPTTPAVPSGTAAPVPAAVTRTRYSLGFDFTPARVPCGPRLPGTVPPHFVGLTPGFVGLYQVNFTLPSEIPPYARRCGGGLTNLTITLAISVDFTLSTGMLDAACICVVP